MTKWYQGNHTKQSEATRYQLAQQHEMHEQEHTLLATLERIEKLLTPQAPRRPYEDQTYIIGNTQSNLYLTYRGRKHLYMFSGVTLTLQLNDIGTCIVPANTWTDISFRETMQLFTTDQPTGVAVWVRATDETISPQAGTGLPMQSWLGNAQIFTLTTGSQASANQTSGANLFNPSTAKSVLIFSVLVMNSSTGQGVISSIRKVTTNPAFTNPLTPAGSNNLGAGVASLMTGSWQASAAAAGTDFGTFNMNGGISFIELLNSGRSYLLPRGVNSGLSLHIGQAGAGGAWSVTYTYAEF